MNNVNRSWELLKASFKVTKSNKGLFVYPLMTLIFALGIAAVATYFGWLVFIHNNIDIQPTTTVRLATYAGFALLAYILTVIGTFFSAAFYSAASKALEGERITVKQAFGLAWRKRSLLFRWAIFSATVGLAISAISSLTEKLFMNKLGLIGKVFPTLLNFSMNLTWSLATVFAVPVLMEHDRKPFDVVKHSAGLFKRTWGENVIADVAFWVLGFTVLTLGGLVTLGVNGLIYLANPSIPTIVFPIVYAILTGPVVILYILAASCAQTLFNAALYRYAETGDYVGPYTPELIKGAYRPRGNVLAKVLRRDKE